MRHVAALAVLVALTAGCAHSGGPSELRTIADEVWARQLESDIAARDRLGLPVERMPDPSHEKAVTDATFARDILERLNRIDSAKLSDDERLTLDIVRWRQQMAIDSLPHFWHRSPVTPYNSLARTTSEVFTRFMVRNGPDAGRYIRLLDEYSRYVDRVTIVVAEQQRRGILIARPALPAIRAMFGAMRQPADSSPFVPSSDRMSALSASQRTDLVTAVRQTVVLRVNPSLQRLLDVLSDEYEAAAPLSVGMSQYRGGTEAYRFLIRLHTSYDLDPGEVHQLGLSEVARIEGELDEIRLQVGFEGTRREFHHFLRTEKRFFENSAEAIGNRLARHVKTVEPHIGRFFSHAPRAPYGVRRLASSLEGALTFGYYKRPAPDDPVGIYFFNGSRASERNLLFGLALMAHELAPGHHFQIVRQAENASLHPLRRENFDTAFVEGWGEYAAALGFDMGIYGDPYDRAGRLMMDMMLSSRLVVDTGMNALGWPRERAMEYLREHTMVSDTEAATETLRYSTDIPGQALAYKIGSLRIMALRERARAQLGSRFDIRLFHEWVIGSGSMPMHVLERHLGEKLRRPDLCH